MILDLFAGAGGVDVGARMIGLEAFGIEYDLPACATRAAAGLWTLAGNIAAMDPIKVMGGGKPTMLWASPPCQAFSTAGKGLGVLDVPRIRLVMRALMKGRDHRARALRGCKDPRSLLVVEPLRWILALQDSLEYIALEQVPPVLELWREIEPYLQHLGFHTWSGVLNAADYGVPQTRQRAILMASKHRAVHPPAATHSQFGGLWTARWISMAEALGWQHDQEVGMDRKRQDIRRKGGGQSKDRRSASEPANTVREIMRSFTRVPARAICGNRLPRWCYDGPASTVVATRRSDVGIVVGRQLPEGEERDPSHGGWTLRHGSAPKATVRSADELAATLFFGQRLDDMRWELHTNRAQREDGSRQVVDGDRPAPTLTVEGARTQWVWKRPSTTIVGTHSPDVVSSPGHKARVAGNHRQTDGVRITIEEAAILQSMPPDYPFQGSRTRRFMQIGNLVPPLVAAHIIGTLLGIDVPATVAALHPKLIA